MVICPNAVHGELGGHIASHASTADLSEVGVQHFLRVRDADHGGAPVCSSRTRRRLCHFCSPLIHEIRPEPRKVDVPKAAPPRAPTRKRLIFQDDRSNNYGMTTKAALPHRCGRLAKMQAFCVDAERGMARFNFLRGCLIWQSRARNGRAFRSVSGATDSSSRGLSDLPDTLPGGGEVCGGNRWIGRLRALVFALLDRLGRCGPAGEARAEGSAFARFCRALSTERPSEALFFCT